MYVNAVGANDSLIFDGQSMATSRSGDLVYLGKAFEEEITVVDSECTASVKLPTDTYGEIEQALLLGIKDYLHKCGFHRVHFGLSGGIDSALVAALAARAIGPENVHALSMPSQYSSEGSRLDAQILADNLGISLTVIPIESLFSAYREALDPIFRQLPENIAEENLQARIRGNLLMAYANKFPDSLLLATGNKSELATGYCTLYGDMTGGLAAIGDLLKTEVYRLARYINKDREIIPAAILEKAPTAELRPNQKDQDTLPPYDILDRILTLYLLENKSIDEIAQKDIDPSLIQKVITMIEKAEYKRRQAPPVLKVSQRAFGTGRRIPIARKIT